MTVRRDDFIAGYQSLYGVSELEADRALRDIELAYAEQQNTELQQAIDNADGQHLKETEELRKENAVLRRMLETIPGTHMRFGVMKPDGTTEEPTQCADWCNACKLERLQSDVNEWKSHEAAARGFGMELALRHQHSGGVIAHIQAGEYSKALALATDELDAR